MGLERDPARAAELFEGACETEMAGCFHLAGLIAAGEGVTQDWERARELYEQACNGTLRDGEGSAPVAESCHRLAELYVAGNGIERDVFRAGSRFRRACSLGHQEACGRQ
jgi:TPR repeat protein